MPTKQRQQVRKGKHGGMQLVLTEDVANLGKQGDLVEVKAGYGRNYLLPNGLATAPTAHNLRLLDRYKQRVQAAREARIADLKIVAEQIQRDGLSVRDVERMVTMRLGQDEPETESPDILSLIMFEPHGFP